MSFSSKDNACKTFAPNIFDKNKCQNCFRPRESHLQSDKDLNKAKAVYGGWLLLAPLGTDFNNPLHKNRKWQRRWFVLYEHGALRYALDETSSTLAQGTIDMNQCTEVTYSDEITAHKFSLRISLPNKICFVRGESREDIMGWYDQLVVYPETIREETRKKKKLSKRKSEGPRLQLGETTASVTSISAPNTPLIGLKKKEIDLSKLGKGDSIDKPGSLSLATSYNSASTSFRKTPTSEKGDFLPSPRNSKRDFTDPHPVDVTSDKSANSPSSDIGKEGRQLPRENRYSEHDGKSTTTRPDSNYFIVDRKTAESSLRKRDVGGPTSAVGSTASGRGVSEGADGSQAVVGRVKKKQSKDNSASADIRKTDQVSSTLHQDQNKGDSSNKENAEPSTVSVDRCHGDQISASAQSLQDQEQGDKRGRIVSKQPEQQVSLTSAARHRRTKSLDRKSHRALQLTIDLLNVKKGWLMLRKDDQWSKYWFVLEKKEIRYYRDTSAEESSTPEEIIDLEDYKLVQECDAQRNYGFEIKTSKNTYILAAMTTARRANWIEAILRSVKQGRTTQDEVKQKVSRDEMSSSGKDDEEDLSAAERSQRRRARIRERRKGGRARTIDIADIRPASTRSLEQDQSNNDVGTRLNRNEAKTQPASITRLPSSLRMEIENEWKKLEKMEYDAFNGNTIPLANPIAETATMVQALQDEVDSLKKQMERVRVERNSSAKEVLRGFEAAKSTDSLYKEIEQYGNQQELSITEQDSSKQDSDRGESDWRLTSTELLEKELKNAHKDLLLEKSKRKELEDDHLRTLSALNKDLEERDASAKISEDKLMESQRRIQELEEQAHAQKATKEETFLQDHIGRLRRHTEEQEAEMKEIRRAFDSKCQNQKQLEEKLRAAKDLIKNYEKQLHGMKEAMKNMEKDATASHRNAPQVEIDKLMSELKASLSSEESLKEKMSRLMMQSQGDVKLLQDELCKEREARELAETAVKNHRKTFETTKKELTEVKETLDELSHHLKASEESRLSLQRDHNDAISENKKLKNEIIKLRHSSNENARDLRQRLSSAEKQLGDIEEIQLRDTNSTESTFKEKLTELEAEMGGTGQMIAARLLSLEPSRRSSDSSDSNERESNSHKIHRLESELEKTSKALRSSEEKLGEMEEQQTETDKNLKAKLKELKNKEDTASEAMHVIANLKLKSKELAEQISATQNCMLELHDRSCQVIAANDDRAAKLLASVLQDVLKLSKGKTPNPSTDQSDKKKDRIADAESRHRKTISRLLQISERLKSGDGHLVSPTLSPAPFDDRRNSSALNQISLNEGELKSRPGDLSVVNLTPSMNDDTAAQLFAKQISMQALLLAEMAMNLRRSQSAPALTTIGRNQSNFGPSGRRTSPQFTAAEFPDSIANPTTGGLLQHVDALAQKLTLEGMLMCELARLKEIWASNRSQRHRPTAPDLQSSSDISSAMLAHAHIGYVVQVYNERISRLSSEAKQARHRADAIMRKLRELVHACKTQDMDAVSNLAVQVDTDSIEPPYSNRPSWEQQVDYGTLHGAQCVPSSPTAEATFLDQEANFFQQLGNDLRCMSADVQSVSKLGIQLVLADSSLQKSMHPSEIGEQASTIAREAIVQAEILYISHRLRRDYDKELGKAKNAVLEQSSHFDALRSGVEKSEESWSGRLKQVTKDHNVQVDRLIQEASRLDKARAEMSKDVEERLTRLSRKHEQELSSCNAQHEKESAVLRKDLLKAKHELEARTKEHMNEITSLKQRLEEIQEQHRKECDETREKYDKKLKKAKAECEREIKQEKKVHSDDVRRLKDQFVKEMAEDEKDFSDQLKATESAKNKEIEELTKKHKIDLKSLEAAHKDAINELVIDREAKMTSLKRNFDISAKETESAHQMEMERIRKDTDSKFRMQMQEKIDGLKNEHDELLEERNKSHREQLRREKEKQSVASNLQSDSETKSKDALKDRISTLENELRLSQSKLKSEQGNQSYQSELAEIRTLCDESFVSMRSSHAKQLEELTVAHRREMEKLREEHVKEIEENKEDTRRVIESMSKRNMEELRCIREEPDQTGSVRFNPLRRDNEKLKNEIQTLSEHYSRKCVELADATERKEKAEDRLSAQEREIRRLQFLQDAIDSGKFESEAVSSDASSSNGKKMADLYQLQVMLRVKASEVDYLKQEVTSLNQQLEESSQQQKKTIRKHQGIFDELTLFRSKEDLARREIVRLKEQLRHHESPSDEEASIPKEVGKARLKPRSYDYQKSVNLPATSSSNESSSSSSSSRVTSLGTSSKKRSSEKTRNRGKI